MKNKKVKILVVVIICIAIVSGTLSFFIMKKQEEERKIKKEKLISEIESHFSAQVRVNRKTNLYQKKDHKYVKIGVVEVGELLILKKEKISEKTKYFYASNLGYYVRYQDVEVDDSELVVDDRYKNYLVFNENVVTKEVVHLYRNDKLIYTLNFSIEKEIVMKDDLGFYIEYFDQLFFIPKDDVLHTYEKINTTEEEATEVPVTVYHFIYLEGDNTCNEMICHHENQIKEEFQYLKDNQYFTMNTTELRLFLEGKIRVPKHSILITIDDGARAENFVPLLEEYQIHATLFLISSWYPKEKFQSSYMEIASHTHDLHRPGLCPGGQGSPLKCLDKDQLLQDLKTSRETLDGTEAFCFPFYEFNDYAIEVVKEAGFKLAFIGGMKKVTKNTDPYHIPRISMNRSTTLEQYIQYVQ